MTKRIYRERFTMHMRLGRGGYIYTYDILDGEKVIGGKSVSRESHKVPERRTYVLRLDDDKAFATAKEFIAAYEATLPKEDAA